MQGVEYSYEWYERFLEVLLSRGYSFGTFDDPVSPGEVLLRHDVDLSVEKALRMARYEAKRGLQSTYFVQLTSRLYNSLERENRKRIQEIASLGHDVGLHFDTHQYWPDERPEDAEVVARVAEERSILETVVRDVISPVSFHVPPKWVLDRRFDEFRSTYEPSLFSEMVYASDSTGRWRENPPLADIFPEPVHVLVHPGLWHEEDTGFEFSVRRATTESCRRAHEQARRDFLDGGSDR